MGAWDGDGRRRGQQGCNPGFDVPEEMRDSLPSSLFLSFPPAFLSAAHVPLLYRARALPEGKGREGVGREKKFKKISVKFLFGRENRTLSKY